MGVGTEKKLSYRDLKAWQKSMDLAAAIYGFTRRLPATERYGLISQMQRSAVSVPANIAEGQARKYRGEFLRFLSTSRGSLAELETYLLLCERIGYCGDKVLAPIWEQSQEAGRILNGLIASLEVEPGASSTGNWQLATGN
jgi:four helix bundle protein